MIDFNQFGKSTKTPVATGATVKKTPSTAPKGTIDFTQFGKSVAYTPPVQPTDWTSTFGSMAKGLISTPATMVARPIQAVAELAGASAEDVNKYNLGGLIAPVPQTYGDVVKDVGRGVQTVALGTGAPIAGGAMFGLGSGLEQQGTNVLTTGGVTNVLVQTLVGMGAGKALDLIGKPLLNTAGKVIGTITPKTLQDVAAQGTKAVSDFMAQHELLGGIAVPLSEKIATGAQAFDVGVNKLFTGAKTQVGRAVVGQYPGLTKENITKRYENVEVERLMKPAKVAGKTYNKSADVVKDAERRGIDLNKVAADNKVYASEHITDGKWDTKDVADTLADEAMSGGPNILRPALKEAEPSVQRVALTDVKNRILAKIGEIKPAILSPEQKLAFAKKVAREYSANSITGSRYKDGYTLTDLYDSKLQTSSKIYKEPKMGGVQSISDTLIGKQKRIESQVFGELLEKNAPPELGIPAYNKAQEEKFVLASYLRTLDGNKAPLSLLHRAIRKTAQLAGATAGAKVAGPFGMFSGFQFGGIVADTFAKASNPVKVAFLKSIGKTEPEIYQIMKDYVTNAEVAKLLRPKLNAPDVIYQGPTQEGKPYTPNRLFGTTPVVETKTIFSGAPKNKNK